MRSGQSTAGASDGRKVYPPEALDKELADVIVEIRSVYEPEQVFLFGSAARGGPWHDLDLLVVAKTEDEFYDRLVKVAELFAKGPHIPTDVIIATPEEFQKAIAENRSFVVEEVLKKGRVVYERRRSTRVAEDRHGGYEVGPAEP